MSAQSEYAKTHDEILKIQENIMRGFNSNNNNANNQTNENKLDPCLNISQVKVISDTLIEETLKGKYSVNEESITIGLCKYPSLSCIYNTNQKLFKVDAFSEEELSKGLQYNETYETSLNGSSLSGNYLDDLTVTELVGYQNKGIFNEEKKHFEIIESQKVDPLPLATKPQRIINNQLKIYITFEQFFLDLDYNLKQKLLLTDQKDFNAIDLNYYKQFKQQKGDFIMFKSGDLPIWGMKVYTDDSNPLSILRQLAIYEEIKNENEIVGCRLIGFELISGIKKLSEPIEIYFDGRDITKEIKPLDFIAAFKYLPTLKNYYGNNVAFEKNGVMSRNWYGSQFLSGHDGLSIALWDVEFNG
ncbi:hypothetical protein ACO0SA_002302 [Hanseniaspora valbyensis]